MAINISDRSKKYGLAAVLMLIGAIGLAGFTTGMEATNSLEFCVSCHSMQTNLEEYKKTVHYKSASGVRAGCPNCHVPKDFGPKMYAKIMAAKDVYHEIMGTIDTSEKYEARRWKMANAVWAKMKASNSRECRTCHSFNAMDYEAQNGSAGKKHAKAEADGKTCIDCHKGIAHKEPEPPEDAGT